MISHSEHIKRLIYRNELTQEDMESTRLYIRDKCKKNLWFLSYYVLGYKDIDTSLHMDMCERYQKRLKKKFSLWLIPRSHLKTTLWTVAGTIFELLRNPDLRFLIVNASLGKAQSILADISHHFEFNELFRWLFPEYCPDLASKSIRKRMKWGVERIDLPCSRNVGKKEGSVEIMGVEASLVSKHYDRMLYDDPVNDENTTTKIYRDKISKWFKNSIQLRHSPQSIVRVIGTRWHFDDLYSRFIKAEKAYRKEAGKNYVPRWYIYHRQVVERVEEGGENIAGYENVQPIWPERYTKHDIEEIKSGPTGVGSYIFSCQYMNDPLPEEDAVFKHSDIQEIDYYDIPDEVVNFIAIDMAVEDTKDGDFSVISTASFDSEGKMYVRNIIRDKMTPSKILDQLAQLVDIYQPKAVAIETTVFQYSIYKNYKSIAASQGINIPWKEMKRGKSAKRKRILALQPRVERGDFYYQIGISNSDWMIEEMTTYPRSTYDDILDTLADLEAVYYSAPSVAEDFLPQNTFEAYHGPLDEEYEEETDCASVNLMYEELY